MAKAKERENSTTDSLVEFSRETEKISGKYKKDFIDYVVKNLPQLHSDFEEARRKSPYFQDDME